MNTISPEQMETLSTTGIGDMKLKLASKVLALFDTEGKACGVWTGSRVAEDFTDAAVIESPEWIAAAEKAIPYFKSFTMSFSDARIVEFSTLINS